MITHTSNQCKICRTVNSLITDLSEGNITCTVCGAVQEERIIDEQCESRNIKEENGGNPGAARLGGPIDFEYFNDISNQIVVCAKRNRDLKNKTYTKESNKQNQLKRVFNLTEQVASLFNLHKKIIDEAKPLLKTVVDGHGISKSTELYCVCIVLRVICRKENIPITLDKLANSFNLKFPKLRKYCYRALRCLVTNDGSNGSPLDRFQVNCKFMYMDKLMPRLDSDIKNCINDLGDAIIKSGILEGKNPQTVIGAIFYFAGKLYKNENMTIDLLSKITKMNKKTIQNSYQILISNKGNFPEAYHHLYVNLE